MFATSGTNDNLCVPLRVSSTHVKYSKLKPDSLSESNDAISVALANVGIGKFALCWNTISFPVTVSAILVLIDVPITGLVTFDELTLRISYAGKLCAPAGP